MSFKSLYNWGPSVAYMGLVFILSHNKPILSDVAGSWSFPGIDKGAHFCEFFVLYLLLYRSMVLEGYSKAAETALIWSMVYGASDEFHQWFLPYRDCEFTDLLADWCGVWAGFALSLRIEIPVKKDKPLNKIC